jgi:hypothetical protein
VKKTTWLAILFVVLVLGYLVTSSFKTQPYRCKICVTYRGRTDCGTGAAQTKMEAQRTATTTACAQIASGVTESNQCENTPPDSVDWLAQR